MLDTSTIPNDDELPLELAPTDGLDQSPTAGQTAAVDRANSDDDNVVKSQVGDEPDADVKPNVLGKLDWASGGTDFSLDNRRAAASELKDDRIADCSQSVAVSVNAEESSGNVLDVVIKREIEVGLEQCPAPMLSCVPVKMETDVTDESDEHITNDNYLKVGSSEMEVDAPDMANMEDNASENA
jgi:hypothetical protein